MVMQPLITSAVIVLILLKEFSVLWRPAADYSLHHATKDEKEGTAICCFALNKTRSPQHGYLYAFIMYTAAFTRAYVLNAHARVYSTSHDWSIPLPRNSLVTGGEGVVCAEEEEGMPGWTNGSARIGNGG